MAMGCADLCFRPLDGHGPPLHRTSRFSEDLRGNAIRLPCEIYSPYLWKLVLLFLKPSGFDVEVRSS